MDTTDETSGHRPPPLPSALHHSVRNTLFDREWDYTLGPDRLHWRDARGSGEVAYSDVTELQLISYGGFGGAQYQARLARKNGRPVKLRSHHYVSLGNFEDRSETYTPFVRELARRIAEQQPQARFRAGSTALWIAWLLIALFIALVAVAVIADAVMPSASAIPAIIVLVVGLPLIWREVRKGRAATFDPVAPPRDLLGSG